MKTKVYFLDTKNLRDDISALEVEQLIIEYEIMNGHVIMAIK